ncbi:MAG: tetratricopeptide repeat protein [bacterium]
MSFARHLLSFALQLIDVQTQEHRWSQDYDRELKDVFAIQSDVAQRVAEALRVELLAGEERQLKKKVTENIEAYDLYLRGRNQLHKYTEDGNRKALEYFEEALDIDPGYAAAYAGLADCYYGLSNIYLPPEQAMPKARAAAKRALEIDNSLAEAHATLAVVRAFYDWDWVAADREFKRAIELNPNYASAHHLYGIYLVANGRFDEAKIELDRAHQLDPLSLSIEVTAVWPDYFGRHYEQAARKVRKTIAMEPDFPPAHLVLGASYKQIGEFTRAIAEQEKAYELNRSSEGLGYLGHTYALAGMRDKAQKAREKLQARVERGDHVPSVAIALI